MILIFINSSFYHYLKTQSKVMLKSTTLLFIILLLASANCFKLWPFSSQNIQFQAQQTQDMKDELNQIFVGDQQVQKGASVTASIMGQMKGIIQTAFIYSGNDYWKNVAWIQNKINVSYPGDWLVAMFNSTNGEQIVPNKTIGLSTYSLNGSWWIYWRGVNHYQPSIAYYLNRAAPGTYNRSMNVYCHSLSNYSYFATDTFKNIVTAVQLDASGALMNEAYQVQTYLKNYNPNINANVLISKKVPFFACQWGVFDSNFIPNNYNPNNNTVFSFPKI